MEEILNLAEIIGRQLISRISRKVFEEKEPYITTGEFTCNSMACFVQEHRDELERSQQERSP